MAQDLSNLSIWQKRLYLETVDLWSVDQHYGADKRSTGETYALKYEGVIGYFERAQFADEPHTVARGRGFSIRRASVFWTTLDQELGRTWIIVQTDPPGNRYHAYRVAENPVTYPKAGLRRMNSRSATVEILDKLPATIATHYGI